MLSKFKFEQHFALFYYMMLQNINPFLVREYFSVIHILSHQPGLKLVWCILSSNESFWIA